MISYRDRDSEPLTIQLKRLREQSKMTDTMQTDDAEPEACQEAAKTTIVSISTPDPAAVVANALAAADSELVELREVRQILNDQIKALVNQRELLRRAHAVFTKGIADE